MVREVQCRLLVSQKPEMNRQEEELSHANHDDTGVVFERIQQYWRNLLRKQFRLLPHARLLP